MSLNLQGPDVQKKNEKKKLKGGLTLVYDADGEGANELSMEELRAALPRYQKILSRASSVRSASM